MKYGVKLTRYGDQMMGLWVQDTDGRFVTEDVILASTRADQCKTRNPKGTYIVEPIPE